MDAPNQGDKAGQKEGRTPKNAATDAKANDTTDPIEIIENACTDATGASPARHLILSKLDKWMRYSNTGKPKDKNCALKVIDKGDCYVFIVKDHKSGLAITGCTRTGNSALMTPEEKAAAQRQRADYERQIAEQSARKHRMLSGMANRLWNHCIKPDDWVKPHKYATTKQVQPLNIRRYISHKRDVLVLPMIDPMSGIKSLYLIYPDGFKRPLKGSQTTGLCMAIGQDLSTAERIWLVEGWATGASLHELKGDAVVVAFTAGNLSAVMDKLVVKYPDAELKLCADDDRATAEKIGKNPGLFYAEQVQKRHPQIALYKPLFPPGAPQGLSDVNDLVNYERGVNHA